LKRRKFLQAPVLAAAAARYARAVRGLPELKITGVKAIPTSAGSDYRPVFVKMLTSEPRLLYSKVTQLHHLPVSS
jgi:hypothetical protein